MYIIREYYPISSDLCLHPLIYNFSKKEGHLLDESAQSRGEGLKMVSFQQTLTLFCLNLLEKNTNVYSHCPLWCEVNMEVEE